MTVAIVDYGSGNLRSAAKAFERAAREAGIATDVIVTSDPDAVRRAERIVLPGVGAFGDCRKGLDGVAGMVDVLEERVIGKGVPFLGICVGMQLMAERGIEYGTYRGLGWIAGDVIRIQPSDSGLKVPHMGWNNLHLAEDSHPIFEGIPDAAHVYFVHSYHLAARPDQVLATTDYGGPVTAAVGRDNMVGTQFHPEKSQVAGLRLIGNFLRWRP